MAFGGDSGNAKMPPRFVDASVFVHAYLRPKRALKAHERSLKSNARAIVARINNGERVVTSTVHLIEIANIVEDWMALADAQTIQRGLYTRDNIRILPVGPGELIEALSLESEVRVGTSDALAAVLMRRDGLSEIYSFDKDFDGFHDFQRLSK